MLAMQACKKDQPKSASTPQPAPKPASPVSPVDPSITDPSIIEVTPDPNGAPSGTAKWDMSYLLKIDPNAVTTSDLNTYSDWLDRYYWKYHSADGITYYGEYLKEEDTFPSRLNNGGDSAIFSGMYLGAAVHRARLSRKVEDLDKVLQSLRGIHILSHISGKPGVLVRSALDINQKTRFNYPEVWADRTDGMKYESKVQVPDILNPGKMYPPMAFYTNTSRDQLTGVIYGLTVTWVELQPQYFSNIPGAQEKVAKAREIVTLVIRALYRQLDANGWTITDHEGRVKETASKVDGLFKLGVMRLYGFAGNEPDSAGRLQDYARRFDEVLFPLFNGDLGDLGNPFSNVNEAYYAFNLNYMRAFILFLLEDDWNRKGRVVAHVRDHLWKHTQHHQNAFFTFIWNVMSASSEGRDAAIYSVKAVSKRPLRSYSSPYYGRFRAPDALSALSDGGRAFVVPAHLREWEGYFLWQREPWNVEKGPEPDRIGRANNSGLSFLVPYWLGRFYGFL